MIDNNLTIFLEKPLGSRSARARDRLEAAMLDRGFKPGLDFAYRGDKLKVSLVCPNMHLIRVDPGSFMRGTGCMNCSHVCPDKARLRFIRCVLQRGWVLASDFVYDGMHSKTSLICPQGHSVQVVANNFKNGDGCSKCSNTCSEQARDRFVLEVELRGFRLGVNFEYVNVQTKTSLICPQGHAFKVSPNNFTRGKGCGICHPGGFNPKLPGILYYLEFTASPGRSVYKIGITNVSVKARYQNCKTPYRVIWQHEFPNGADALRVESHVKRRFKAYRCMDKPVHGLSNAELFHTDILRPGSNSLRRLMRRITRLWPDAQ